MKVLYTLILAALIMVSCQEDPQKKAQKNAEHYAEVAQSEAAAAQSELEQSRENANSAVIHASKAQMNDALKQVEMPELESNQAREIAKKIANEGIDYVNADDYKQANKYSNKFNESLDRLDKLEEKGTITKVDADKVRGYITDLAKAISIEVRVVEITPVSAE